MLLCMCSGVGMVKEKEGREGDVAVLYILRDGGRKDFFEA